ncbi:MAG: hypothetical protein P1V51_07845 [Deltaproteobacteria bacterium]|nr:hypothetical protein [Deltaproteobacteria bacterium]
MSHPARHDHEDAYRPGLILAPGHGCLSSEGRWVLSRPGPISCVRSDAPRGAAPLPMEMAAMVDAALDAAPLPPRWVVVGADGDPLLTGGGWGEAMLAAAVHVVERGVGLWVATRGAPSQGAWATLLEHAAGAGGARLELGLFSLDPSLASLYEPGAPSPADRLAAARRLAGVGVTLSARVSPLLPWICDTPEVLEEVTAHLAKIGIDQVHTSYLHLDAGGQGRLGRLPPAHRALLRGLLRESPHREGEAWLLPAGLRAEGYRRFHRAAARHGVTVRVCRSANPDLEGATRCFATEPEQRASAAPSSLRPSRPAPRPASSPVVRERRALRPDEDAEDAAPGTQLKLL